VSKSHAMTGWRIGYAAGPVEILAAQPSCKPKHVNPTSIAQKAASKPSTAIRRLWRPWSKNLKRANVMVDRLNAIPWVTCMTPQGRFLCFPEIAGLLGRKYGGKVLATSPMWPLAFLMKQTSPSFPAASSVRTINSPVLCHINVQYRERSKTNPGCHHETHLIDDRTRCGDSSYEP